MITTTNILLAIIVILLTIIIQGIRVLNKTLWGLRDSAEMNNDLINELMQTISEMKSAKYIRKYAKALCLTIEELQK